MLLHGLLPGVWFGARDPLGAEAGFADMAGQALSLARQNGAGWIATSNYRTYAELRWQLRNEMPVVEVIERSRFIGFATPALPQGTAGASLYVFDGTTPNRLVAGALKGDIKPVGSITRQWRGQAFGIYGAALFTGWLAPLDPPAGSPYYAWVPLA